MGSSTSGILSLPLSTLALLASLARNSSPAYNYDDDKT